MTQPPAMAALAIGVTASRETPQALRASLDSLLAALGHHGGRADICLLINGNDRLADVMCESLRDSEPDLPAGSRLHVDVLSPSDKAHALNQFLLQLAAPAATTVLMDGYVRPETDALRELDAALRAHPQALAATGLPRSGWSARRLAATAKREGGLHGNLFALSGQALAQLRSIGFRLPLGLYRVDAVLGAALAFGLELGEREWAPLQRICLAERVAWQAPTLQPWRWRDWQTYFRRRQRQQAGHLENAAVRHSFAQERRRLADLPPTAAALVARWAQAAPEQAQHMLAQPPLARAWAEMQTREPALLQPPRHERRLSL